LSAEVPGSASPGGPAEAQGPDPAGGSAEVLGSGAVLGPAEDVGPAARGEPIRAEGVTAGYGGDPVIRDISVHAEPGEVVSVVGPNGSGKSTLLKSLVGVVRVSRGRVRVGARDVTNLPPEEVARAGVGYVPQVDDIFAPLTVRENLEMGGYLLPSRQVGGRIEHVLTVFPRLGAMINRTAGKLSGGERKMLAMGRVLMLEPGVFLLDEPTANLAPAIAGVLLDEHVRRLARRGAAVLIVEQRAKAVLAISDRTYVLGGGELRMAGTPAELSASPEFVDSFLGGRGRAVPSGDC
jgi:ABC-type branched-subunit amino acid transport system ATPase component